MFAYINGILEDVDQNEVVLDVNGIGYLLTVPSGVVERLPSKGSAVKLYTYFVVREDAHELYGFIDIYQKRMFQKLITVSGIGPKGGLSILSVLNTEEIAIAIITEDIMALTKAPGIGKKTAQRIILELKDKMDDFDITRGVAAPAVTSDGGQIGEVIEALLTLGYSQEEANAAVATIGDVEGNTSDLIKAALKNLDR